MHFKTTGYPIHEGARVGLAHGSVKTLLAACLLAIVALPGQTQAQQSAADANSIDTPSYRLPQGPPLTTFPPTEKGTPGESEPWREDLEKITRGIETQLSPDAYRKALRSTGMADYLSTANFTELPGKAAASAWIRRGPVGGFGTPKRNGRISGVLVYQNSLTLKIFAGSCQGGLWLAENSDITGPIWQDIGRGLPNPSVRAFAVHPNGASTIFVGTGDWKRYLGGGMFVTLDQGATWNEIAMPNDAGRYFRILYVDSNASIMLAASSDGLFRSTNGGATWTFSQYDDGTPTDANMWSDLIQHPNNDTVLYACNSGRSAGTLSGVYKSIDSGATWIRLSDPTLPTEGSWGRASLAICAGTPNTMAVLVESGNRLSGVYKTIDGGSNWSNISGQLVNTGGTAWGHAQAIAIRPNDPDQIFVGAVNLMLSNDGGSSWTIDETHGINWGHADQTQLYFNEIDGPDILWICNDGGIYYHDFNTGLTRDFIGGPTTGLACSEVDFMDADRDVRLLGLQDNGILRSMDGGQTWVAEASSDGADVEIYDPETGDYFYNSGVFDTQPQWRTYRKSGTSPAEYLNNPSPAGMPSIQYFPDTERMATHNDRSIYSLDASSGTIWTQEISDLLPTSYAIRSVHGSRSGDGAYYVLYWDSNPADVTILRNNGAGWISNHAANVSGTAQRIACVQSSMEWPGEAWVGLEGGQTQAKIMHTTNYGQDWEDLTNGLEDLNTIRTIAVQPFNPNVIYVGSDLGVHRSTDGGDSWSPFMTGLPIGRCSELRFVIDDGFSSQHTLVLSIDGRGMWSRTIDAPPIVFVDKQNLGFADGTLEHPYPTVTAGLSNAPTGAIVAVRTETYDEPQLLSRNVTLLAWGGTTLIK